MSALRIEKQLGRILDFSHKEHFCVARINCFEIPRMVTGLVTVNGNSLAAKSRTQG